jgi:hypothetical protein
MMDADRRARLLAAKREIAEILKPQTEAQRKLRREAARARRKAMKAAPMEGQRQPRERDPGFLAYLRRQPCEARHLGGCDGPIEAAHIRYSDASRGSVNPGMQRKNHDRHANPLCRFHHHHDQHQKAERSFWQALGKDAYDTAAGHYAAYCDEPNSHVSLEKSTRKA